MHPHDKGPFLAAKIENRLSAERQRVPQVPQRLEIPKGGAPAKDSAPGSTAAKYSRAPWY